VEPRTSLVGSLRVPEEFKMAASEAWTGVDSARDARSPSEFTLEAWRDILWRVWAEFTADRLTLIAAGATFYLLLALFPALAAFVSIYGFVADPVTIADHIAFLGGLLPSGGVDLIRNQLVSLSSQDTATLSFGFIFGLAFALWSANNGIKTLFEALNVAYDETEKRSFIRLNLLSLLFTLAAIAIGILFIAGVGVVPAVIAFMGLSGSEELLISLLRWPVLFVAAAIGICVLYRYGPSRERAKWRWVTWGAVFATALWLLASVLFSWYLANFADYNATYGSLGAVIGFMMWTWISVVILLLGAELDAEMEHQTARDSTTGVPRPMGTRGATMADTLGASRHSPAARMQAEDAKSEPMQFDRATGADGLNAGSSPRPAKSVAQRPALRDVLAAWAVPVFAVATVAAMEVFDRRREQAPAHPRPLPRRTKVTEARQRQHPAVRFGDWPRTLLSDPELRARVVGIAQVAAGLAGKVGKAPKRAKKRWWR
jgi:membrane protein